MGSVSSNGLKDENIDFNGFFQLVASDMSLATSFFISLQSSSRSFCCSSLPNRTRCRWAPVWGRPVGGIFLDSKISILTAPSQKKDMTNRSCLSFGASRAAGPLHPSVLHMLGGSEFRLRRGFACGKTLLRPVGPAGGWKRFERGGANTGVSPAPAPSATGQSWQPALRRWGHSQSSVRCGTSHRPPYRNSQCR